MKYLGQTIGLCTLNLAAFLLLEFYLKSTLNTESAYMLLKSIHIIGFIILLGVFIYANYIQKEKKVK